MAANETRNQVLSPLDWLMPRSRIVQILCFSSCDEQLPQILLNGLVDTVADVPYLLRGVFDGDFPKGSVMLSEPNQSVHDLLVCQDRCQDVDYDQIKAAGFPPSAFIRADIFPSVTLARDGSSPAFRAVLSAVKGGFLLCVSVHHSTTDITGMGFLLRLWASHCGKPGQCGKPVFDSSRDAMIGLKGPATKAFPSLLHLRNVEGSKASKEIERPEGYETAILKISKRALQALKSEVNECLSHLEITWVSTGDIVTAMLWSAMVDAEDSLKGLDGMSSAESHKPISCPIRIPVNVRGLLSPPLSANYLGAAFCIVTAYSSKQDLRRAASSINRAECAQNLAKVAVEVRRAIKTVSKAKVLEMLGYLSAAQDITGIQLGPEAADISIVSWADQGIYEADWGSVIGFCEAVRLPRFKSKRYPIILPRLQNGDMEVILSLEASAMRLFKSRGILQTIPLHFL